MTPLIEINGITQNFNGNLEVLDKTALTNPEVVLKCKNEELVRKLRGIVSVALRRNKVRPNVKITSDRSGKTTINGVELENGKMIKYYQQKLVFKSN